MQVYFHAAIAEQEGRFTLEDVAGDITDKLVERHPYVFGDGEVPDDLNATWEAAKRAKKGRMSSLDGIPVRLSALARAAKVVSRARSHGVPVDLTTAPVTAEEVGRSALDLVARAQASGVDPEQAVREALRGLEHRVRAAEAEAG